MELDGGGTATRDKYVSPYSASFYIAGKGHRTTEGTYSGTAYDGQSYGGGLLVIYADKINVGDNAKFSSTGKTVNGSSGAWKSGSIYCSQGSGGGSGGGSVNIFYNTSANGFNSSKMEVITGSYSPRGSYNVGTIESGTYRSLISNTIP